MDQPSFNLLTVVDKKQLSPNFLRITFHGETLDNSFAWKPGCYIKLIIELQESRVMRSYTVRSFDWEQRTLCIDFALHEPAGPALGWALKAQKGDAISYKGPGHLKVDISNGDWYLFAADPSALPAALSAMESLPQYAKGYAFLEVLDVQDQQDLKIPDGIEVKWLIHSKPKIKSTQQLEAIQQLSALSGTPNVFVAGELSTIREIRKYLTTVKQYENAISYISSYWKIGANSEEHKLAKKSAN